jgi:hypothetical protein
MSTRTGKRPRVEVADVPEADIHEAALGKIAMVIQEPLRVDASKVIGFCRL